MKGNQQYKYKRKSNPLLYRAVTLSTQCLFFLLLLLGPPPAPPHPLSLTVGWGPAATPLPGRQSLTGPLRWKIQRNFIYSQRKGKVGGRKMTSVCVNLWKLIQDGCPFCLFIEEITQRKAAPRGRRYGKRPTNWGSLAGKTVINMMRKQDKRNSRMARRGRRPSTQP